MAGCGKTAAVDRFLRVLPGGYPPLPDLAKDDLRPADGTFVFSFFDASEEAFFSDLASWLTTTALDSRPSTYGFPREDPGYGIPPPATTSYRQLYEWLLRSSARRRRLLLVLDGLDAVQDATPDERTIGRIADARLKNLIVDCADGVLGIAIIVTTRYPLVDAIRARTPYLHRITVGELSPQACCDLLRARGVRSSDERLVTLSREHAFHAFAVDLLGGYIAEYCGGDPDLMGRDHSAAGGSEGALESVAEQYRQTLAVKDPAALALAERLGLFRTGVSADRLARIFRQKKELSGASLARLTAETLQSRLAVLARLRVILEWHEPTGTRYGVHPALRDVLVRRVPAAQQIRIHTAALEDAGITDDVENWPAGIPPDEAEGLTYHALAAGSSSVAWRLFRSYVADRDWSPHGYHREERLCRAMAAGKPAAWVEPHEEVLRTVSPQLIFAWGTVLNRLGRLESADRCFLFLTHHDYSEAFTRLYDIWLNCGYIQIARRSLAAWIDRLVRTVASDEYDFVLPIVTELDELAQLHGYAASLAGQWALHHWRGWEFVSGYVRPPAAIMERPVTGVAGIHHARLLLRLGKAAEAREELRIHEEYAAREYKEDDRTAAFWMQFKLLQAELAIHEGRLDEALDFQQQGHDWAAARDANDVLCTAHLVRAQIELAQSHGAASAAAALHAANKGLRLARACGYALLHIDLLVARAEAQLALGYTDQAEQDLVLALTGTSSRAADADASGLLYAMEPRCRYAWGIVTATHWRGVVCLQQAARLLQRAHFDPAELPNLPDGFRAKVTEGSTLLRSAAEHWKNVAGAAGEHTGLGRRIRRVLEDVDGGRLPGYPLNAAVEESTSDAGRSGPDAASYDVFLSYNNEDVDMVRDIAETLASRGVKVWFDRWQIRAGSRFQDDLDGIIRSVRSSIVFVGASGIGPWQKEEIHACLRQSVHRGQAVIPALLPNAAVEPVLPLFLDHRSRVDLRSADGLDLLLWAVKGTKPQGIPLPQTGTSATYTAT
jgi:hypothetical protein